MKWLLNTIILIIMPLWASYSYALENARTNILSEDNLLVVELSVDQTATTDNIEIYQHDGGFLLPLGFLAQLLDFPIDIDLAKGQAYGWFIKENRTFTLDVNAKKVLIGGKAQKLDTGIIVVGAGDIYVDSSLFSAWFPIDAQLDFKHLTLKLKTREKLPFQEKLERENLKNRQLKQEKKNNFPKLKTKASNLTIPFMDIDLGHDFDSKGEPNNNGSYSILAQGDVAKHTTNFFLSGETKDSLTGMRLKSGNKDNDGNLLGKMHATEYSVGDIDGIALPLVTTHGRGRGFLVSNYDLSRPDQFDTTSFIGDSQPGWEVEIYRNGDLLDFQVVTENGRYEFANVPILYGNNSFRIVSYGPQGQVREEVRNFTIDDSLAKKGKFNYSIAADEKNRSIFGVDERIVDINTTKTGRFVGNMEYGITDKLTAAYGVVSTPVEDYQVHNYQTIGLKSGLFGMLTTVNGAYDTQNNGMAGQMILNTNIKDINARFEHRQFSNFVSEEEIATLQRRKSLSKFDVNGRIAKIFPTGLSYTFGVQEEKFVNSLTVDTFSNRLSTSVKGIGLSNNIEVRSTEVDPINPQNTSLSDGSFAIRGSYRQVFLRLTADYYLQPNVEWKAVSISVQKDLSDKVNIRADIKRDITDSDLTSVNIGLNKEYKYHRLSAIVSADTTNNYTIGTRISFAIGHNEKENKWFASNRSIANDGAISASAFLDNNNNGIFDADDKELENVGFRSGNRKYPPAEGEKSTLITGTEAYQPADMEVDLATLEDPFLAPKVKGYSVETRPGVVTNVQFPLVYTTEIDGTVYFGKRPIARAVVELINKDGKVVNTAKSEYDGFYVFPGVMQGEYTVRVDREILERYGITKFKEIPVSVPKDSDFISGIDVRL
jgi:hypothetical protein